MRRAGRLFERVTRFDTLLHAAQTAAKGKRESRAAAAFLERAEPEVLRLHRSLIDGTWRPRRAHEFVIHDPKRRTITAVPFEDQVVHHALMAVLEPVFERRMIFHSYACRKGKGTHAALARAKGLVRRFPYFLRLDVASFFPSVSHRVMRETIARVVKDRRVLDLCATILRGPPELPATYRGLPIGSLTSQWFANLLLDRVDHHVKETMHFRGYLRYMDDVAVFDERRESLHEARVEIGTYLGDVLDLALKPSATMVAPVTEGLPFLGWLLFPGVTRLRPANRKRYRWRLRQRTWEMHQGLRSAESHRQGVASIFELLRAGDTLQLRRRWAEEVQMKD